MNKRGLLGVIILIIGILLIAGFSWFTGEYNSEEDVNESGGMKCVPASCCHPTECVLSSEASDCSGTFCSMNCEPGTMDCGQGKCGIIDGKCGVIWNE